MAIPIITSVTPGYGTTLGGTVVTIVGSSLSAPAPVVVRFGGVTVTPITNTGTQITAAAPAHAIGAVDVVVQNGDGSATRTAGFTYVLVPTIASVTPNAGLSRGTNLVAIAGTGFRVPPAPPSTGYVGGPAISTVKVTFDGVVSPWAHAITSTLIYARVPSWTGTYAAYPAGLDVRVANLDDAGVERVGENVTRVDGYAISRPELAAECYLQRVLRELIKLLKRHVVENVGLTLGRDYQEDLTDWERIRATTPCLALYGPRLVTNRFHSINREDTEAVDATTWLQRKEPVTVDLEFEVRSWATAPEHAYALAQALLLTFRDIVRLPVLRDPLQPGLGFVEYEIEIPWGNQPDFASTPNFNDLYTFGTRLLIRGVHLDDESGTVILRGWDITANDGDPSLETQAVAP